MQPFKVGPAEGLPDVQATDAAFNGALEQAFTFIGAFAVLFVIFGAFRYMTSDGDASKLQQAKNTILYAIVGLLVAVFAFVIVRFVSGEIG